MGGRSLTGGCCADHKASFAVCCGVVLVLVSPGLDPAYSPAVAAQEALSTRCSQAFLPLPDPVCTPDEQNPGFHLRHDRSDDLCAVVGSGISVLYLSQLFGEYDRVGGGCARAFVLPVGGQQFSCWWPGLSPQRRPDKSPPSKPPSATPWHNDVDAFTGSARRLTSAAVFQSARIATLPARPSGEHIKRFAVSSSFPVSGCIVAVLKSHAEPQPYRQPGRPRQDRTGSQPRKRIE